MCRFAAYLGRSIIIDELLFKPENSLVNQSYDAEEMSQPLNGDGFGLGWYAPQVRDHPGLFRSITPAWNNQNLRYNASMIRTNCLFAHVRAASEGGITEYNCHPFHFERYLMMHNGGIHSFKKIKRALLNLLDDPFFMWIEGQTDSEHIFALLMQELARRRSREGRHLSSGEIAECFQQTFQILESLKQMAGVGEEVSAYNMMITDGDRIYGTRYSTRPDKVTPTLYYSVGSRFQCVDGDSRMIPAGADDQTAVLIVSEKLTNVEEDWKLIPANHFIAVNEKLEVELLALH